MTVTVHPRPSTGFDDKAAERWRNVPSAIIADVSNGTCLIDPDIRPLMPPGKQPRLFGRAVTALCAPPDFGAVLHALDYIAKGDVLVIAAQGHRSNAMIGGILGGHLRRKGVSGIVCDGAVRDVAELAGWPDLSVYARSITPRGPTAVQQGEVNGTVNIGGRMVRAGDLVIGDDDGLVCISGGDITALVAKAEAKLALESEWQASLASGKSMKETFGL